MKSKYVIMILVLLFFVVSGYLIKNNITVQVGDQISNNTAADEPSKGFSPQTDDQGDVSVEVTPQSLFVEEEAVFEVTLNTHSVELDYDLREISQLVDDQGNAYRALSWSGESGGHHLQGEIVFSRLSKTARWVELIISQVGGVQRKFRWNL